MSRTAIGVALAAIFISLGLLHVYWAVGGQFGRGASVPSLHGQPLFKPSASGTLLVAAGLLVAALTTAGAAGWFGKSVPVRLFRVLMLAISLVFLLRAIGDWKYVGFFQRSADSAFAYWDLRLYSPLCLFISVAASALAWLDE